MLTGKHFFLHFLIASKNVSALKEAFEIFCNNGVAGSSRAELLATFCDLKGGSEKLINEVIEDKLEKVCLLLLMSICLLL